MFTITVSMTSFDRTTSFKCLQGFSGHQLHDQYVFPLSDFYTQPSCVLQQVWCLHSDSWLIWAEELAIPLFWSSTQDQPAWTHLFPSTTDKLLLYLPETRYVLSHCCIITEGFLMTFWSLFTEHWGFFMSNVIQKSSRDINLFLGVVFRYVESQRSG